MERPVEGEDDAVDAKRRGNAKSKLTPSQRPIRGQAEGHAQVKAKANTPESSPNRSRRREPLAQAQAITGEPPIRRRKRTRADAQKPTQEQAQAEAICMKCNSAASTPKFRLMLCGPAGHPCPNAMHPQCDTPPRLR